MTTLSRYSPICAKKRALHSAHPDHPDLVAPWVYTFTHARSNTKKNSAVKEEDLIRSEGIDDWEERT